MAMKFTARFSLCALFLLLLLAGAPLLAADGPSASGDFHFSSGDQPMAIEFDVVSDARGTVDGRILVRGTVTFPEQDVDGESRPTGESRTEIAIEVAADCLTVNRNSAVLGGRIADANIPAYVGRRFLLAVVDNEGDPDQFTWGLYATPDITWVASDAELERDPGVGLTWIATDFEREDDIGIPSHPSRTVDCATFPAGSYAFEALPRDSGDIQVRP